MTQGEGQARIPMTGLRLTENPNLKSEPRCQRDRRPTLDMTDKEQPYLSLKTTPSIQAPKKTTLEMSEQEVQVERRHAGDLSLTEHNHQTADGSWSQDTDEGGGEDSHDGSDGDGSLGIPQVT